MSISNQIKSTKWNQLLLSEVEKPYFQKIDFLLEKEYSNKNIYPPFDDIFKAFNSCNFEDIKVVILGQDPYHGIGQAHGLAFSVNDQITIPPSLVNIFKELHSDLGIEIPKTGNLSYWANQGVFLLNSTLTVEESKSNSHSKIGWGIFTDFVIKTISDHSTNTVFILWGSFAQKKDILINQSKHLILKAPHPSPLSVYRGFYGCKHFSKTNQYLKTFKNIEIDWSLTI